jgi:adenylate cyclase
MQTFELRHRLLAILAADGVGFSRLMATDERATIAVLDAARDVFREQIAAHGGRLVDTAGDSVLAVFDTAAGAVSAGLAVQARLREMRGDAPADSGLRFRVGVHLGDVFEKADGTVYGDGVNIAARLQALAHPDGLTVSQSVQAAVQGHVSARFEDMGAQSVKNIARPVQAFRVRAGTGTEAAASPRRRLGRLAITGLAASALVAALGVWLAGAWPDWPPWASRSTATEASAS